MKKILLISFIFLSILGYGQENLNNGIKHDGTGKINLNVNDCICPGSIVSSLIDNYDFEQKKSCPNGFAQFNTVTGWFSPSTSTPDYINSCGFIPVSATDAEIYPFPAKNGNAVAGILVSQDYKEFIATCTNSTLTAGIKYQINFDIASSTSGRDAFSELVLGQVCNFGRLNGGKLDITVYGKSNCDTKVPPASNKFPEGWLPMGKVTYLPSKKWNQLSIEFTPSMDINAIMLGPSKELSDSYVNEYDYHLCFPYFYLDNIILNKASTLGLTITSTGSFCENNLALNANTDSSLGNDYTYQWYKDGVAIPGAINKTLSINYTTTNQGNYQVKITNLSSCKVSPFYNVTAIIDVPEYSIVQSPCFPGTTTLTITTPADEYSFDGGVVYSTNSSLSNLTAYNNPIYISIKKNGCYSSLRNVILTYPPFETISTTPKVTVVQPTCGESNGSLTVTTPALEYSFDDGATWTTNPVLSNLPPNPHYDYKIKIKTLLGCITSAYYAVMYPYLMPMPTLIATTNASCGSGGTISITPEPALQYSIDGGVNWSTNPIFTNLNADSYYVMTKNALGCVSQIKIAYIGVDHTQKPQVTFTQPTCGTLGSITVKTIASQYSFDGGTSWTSNNVANNLLPGFYRVVVKDNKNCISQEELISIQNYLLDITLNYTFENATCSNNGSIKIITAAEEFSIDNGQTWCSNPLFLNLCPGDYFIKVRNGANCESTAKYIRINDFTSTVPTYKVINASCNSYGSITITTPANFYSFDNGQTWSQNNSILNLTGNLSFNVMVKNSSSCISQSTNVQFNSTYLTSPSVTNYQVSICDELNNETENVNLSSYIAFLSSNYSNYTFHYFSSRVDAESLNITNEIKNFTNYEVSKNKNVVFVTVTSPENCSSIAEITFSLLESPMLNSIPDSVILCENSTVLVNGGNSFDSYLWSNGATSNSILINQPGNYSLTATSKYGNEVCKSTKNFTVVLSNRATITKISTQDFTENNNVIEIKVSGLGNYEYSLDGVSYQNDAAFTGLTSGIYTIYVRDKNNCGVTTDDLFLLMYPKFFTPNGDGFNDTWNIEFSSFEPELEISIFDRYGKLIKKIDHSNSWDGRFGNQELPADDYWFIVKRKNGKEFKSHFSLKR